VRKGIGWALALTMTTIGTSGVAKAQVARPGGGLQARDFIRPDANVTADRLNIRGMIRPDITTTDGLRTYSRFIMVGRCMAGLGRKGVAEALASPMNAASERRQILVSQERLSSCQVTGMPNTLTLVRGVLSEGMYHKLSDEKAVDPGSPLSTSQIVRWSSEQNALIAPLLPADRGLTLIVDCLVVRQPQLADQILAAGHGSSAEQVGINTLLKGSPQCVPDGRSPSISRSYMRAFIASSAYRLVRWRAGETS